MSKVRGLLLVVMLFTLVATVPAHAGPFEGEWVGHWRNSLGERGHDSLSLYETRHGRLRGNWSGDVDVWGEETGERTIRLSGRRSDGVSYDITAYRQHGEIELHYYATRPNGTTYEGWSRLHRPY